MTAHNGAIARMHALLRDRPGLTSAQIAEAIGVRIVGTGLMAYALRAGHVHRAGLKRLCRYYATATEALAAHDALVEATRAERAAKEREWLARQALVRRGRRHALGCKPVDKRSTVLPPIGKGTVLASGVRLTIAPPLRDRFAPEPGFVGVITADWLARRAAA